MCGVCLRTGRYCMLSNFWIFLERQVYSISKKSWPILYSKSLYETGQDFLDIQYVGLLPLRRVDRATESYAVQNPFSFCITKMEKILIVFFSRGGGWGERNNPFWHITWWFREGGGGGKKYWVSQNLPQICTAFQEVLSYFYITHSIKWTRLLGHTVLNISFLLILMPTIYSCF